MKKEDHANTMFYQNLGKLFYAIACVDGSIEVDEINTLKTMVEEEWSINEDAFSILDSFNWLHMDQDYDSNTCFNSFLSFFYMNKKLFTENRKTLIFKTANAIASSFSNRNKSELIILAKLDMELKKNMKNHLLIIIVLSLWSCQTKTDKIQPTEQNLTQSVYTSVIIQPDSLHQVKG